MFNDILLYVWSTNYAAGNQRRNVENIKDSDWTEPGINATATLSSAPEMDNVIGTSFIYIS